jgi:hypothetical protein
MRSRGEVVMGQIPMTSEEFLGIFRAYNSAVWPAPILLTCLALLAAYRAARSRGFRDRIVVVVLALLWAWSGVAYHLLHHAPYNPAAVVFGILFIVQAGLFLCAGMRSESLRFGLGPNRYGIAGALIMVFALAVYPVLGYALGHRYPETPTFGAPCPVTIFTFGLLLWTVGKVKWYVLAIPCLWAFVAVGAATSWGVLEDLAMPVAAVISTGLLLSRNRRHGDQSGESSLEMTPRDFARQIIPR